MATWPTIRKQILAKLEAAGQPTHKLSFYTEKDGSKVADLTMMTDRDTPDERGCDINFGNLHIIVQGEIVTWEVREASLATKERLYANIGGKMLPRNKYKYVYPQFPTLDEALAAFTASRK